MSDNRQGTVAPMKARKPRALPEGRFNLTLYVPAETRDQLTRLGNAYGMSRGALVRKMVDRETRKLEKRILELPAPKPTAIQRALARL